MGPVAARGGVRGGAVGVGRSAVAVGRGGGGGVVGVGDGGGGRGVAVRGGSLTITAPVTVGSGKGVITHTTSGVTLTTETSSVEVTEPPARMVVGVGITTVGGTTGVVVITGIRVKVASAIEGGVAAESTNS
jgi:hypothetical protein